MGGQKTIAYKQLGLSMDIETKVVQHVSSSNLMLRWGLTSLKSQGIGLDNLKPYTPIPSLKTSFSLFHFFTNHRYEEFPTQLFAEGVLVLGGIVYLAGSVSSIQPPEPTGHGESFDC